MSENKLSYNEQTDISNKKISVFHLEHFGGIAQAITLRARLHPDDYAVLVVGDYGNINFQTCGRLVSCGVFDKFIYYKINDFARMEDEDALEEKICQFFDAEFKDINFNDINKIYTHCDLTNTFEIYLSIKKLKYYLYDGAILKQDLKMTDAGFLAGASVKGYNNVLNKYKARAGFSDSCVGYMIFKESKINAYIDSSKVIVYDFNKELTLIDENFKEKIVAAFEIDRIDDDSQLILTNSNGMMGNARQLSVKQRPLLIQYLIDFTRGITKPVIKPHTFDHIDYTNFNAKIMNLNFPIEFLNLTGDSKKISKAVTMLSTAIHLLQYNDSCEQIEWGFEYLHWFQSIPILYAVAGLLSSINVRGRRYHMIGENDKWVKSFYRCSKYNISEIRGASPKIIGNVILFVDSSDDNVKNNIKIGLESAHNDGIVCFLNMKTQLTDYDIPINILNEIIPFKINVDAEEGSLDTSREHTVYFFTKNPEIRKKIQSFSMSEYFKYSKIKVTVDPNSNLQSQIDFLRFTMGILYKRIKNI